MSRRTRNTGKVKEEHYSARIRKKNDRGVWSLEHHSTDKQKYEAYNDYESESHQKLLSGKMFLYTS